MTPCIEWKHYRKSDGYGQLRKGGRNFLAHRVAYCEHHAIDIASIAGIVVRHICDNPPCINPDHLELGTPANNSADMVKRGRSQKGETHHKALLNVEQIHEIRARYVKYCRLNGSIALAEEFKVASVTIRDIISRRRWNHV